MLCQKIHQLWKNFLFLFATFVTIGCDSGTAYAAENLVVGQVTSLSGTNGAELGTGLALGAKIYFEHINSQGGIYGRKVRLVSLDDKYIPEDTVKLTQKLIDEEAPIALLGYRGTANTLALIKSGLLTREGIPLIGTLTGAAEIQDGANIYHTRTSYALEIQQLVSQIVRQGYSRLAVFYANDAFGQSGLRAAEDAVAVNNKNLGTVSTIVAKDGYFKEPEKIDSSTKKALATILAAKPMAIIVIAVGSPAIKFLQACRDTDPTIPLFSMSVVNSVEVTKQLGSVKAAGIGFTQVFPYPFSDTNPLAREYRALLRKYAPGASPDYFGLEGFINAKLLVTALRKAGGNPTRAKLILTLNSLGEVDLGNFWLTYSSNKKSGSKFTELTVLSRSGTLLK